MEKLILKLLDTYSNDATEIVSELHDKTINADHLRQLESDLIEAKDSLTMFVRVLIHVGREESIKDAVFRMVDIYRRNTFSTSYEDRCTDVEKISIFSRIIVSEALSFDEVRDLLRNDVDLLKNVDEIDDIQRLWFRAFILLVPQGMRTVISSFRLGTKIYGFDDRDLREKGKLGNW